MIPRIRSMGDACSSPLAPRARTRKARTSWYFYRIQSNWSCTCILRLIRQPDKPGKILSFLHLYEGLLPWYPISFSTSWCWLPWCGCASCSIGRGQATPPCARRHQSLYLQCHSATGSANLLRVSPQSRTAMPVSTPPLPARKPPQLHLSGVGF